MKKLAIILIVGLLSVGCAGEYKGMPSAEMLAYQTYGTYGALHSLSTAYASAINDALRADTLHPGMYADYGVTLALMGHPGPACRMLNAEMRAFPESRSMIQRLKQTLIPDLIGDTLCDLHDTINLVQLAGWGYDSLTALQRMPRVASVIDSTDSAWISVQTPSDSTIRELKLTANQKRELLEQEQQEALRKKQAIADSIAQAKQARIDARNKAKLERDKKRKAEAKARKARETERKRAQKAKKKGGKK